MNLFYEEVGSERSVFKSCFEKKIPLLLKGPTGCGKSVFIEHMAHALGRPLISVACNEDTSASDLLGRFLIKGNETVWQDGPVTRAVKSGAILYLDEIAEAREDVVIALHPITDHRRTLFLDRLNESITAHPEFFCVASYNPGYQRGLKELKPSTRQRFVSLRMNYPKPEIEKKILIQKTGVHEKDAERLTRLAEKVRGLSQLGLRETLSTRILVYAASLIANGLPTRQACRLSISETLSDDHQVNEALNELIALHF